MIIDLDELMEMQRALQSKINGYDIDDQSLELRIENIKLNVLALGNELHEALDETGWKPWASARFINEEPFKGELIDAFHFLMNLFLHANMDAAEVQRRYMEKHGINVRRQDEGYDGVSNKCPACHRDLTDNPPREYVSNTLVPHRAFHCVCGQWLYSRSIDSAV